ncbi:MAG: ATP-grasp domain-containing protein [Dehalococcoidales bacterium]
MTSFNILFTSIGRRVALVRLFRAALARVKLKGKIIGADLLTTAPALWPADGRYRVCPVGEPGYIPQLLEICQREKVRLLVPLIDPELTVLARNRERFAELGTTVLISHPDTISICQDKSRTNDFFRQNSIPAARVYRPEELAAGQVQYPVLVKPAYGSGSQGVFKANNERELSFFIDYVPRALIQEFLAGREYTIDVLADFQGRVRCIVPRLRMEVRAGEVSKGMTVRSQQVMEMAKGVVEKLPGAAGPLTVQAFMTGNGLKFVEINPRFGGGFPLSAQAGADFPGWIIELTLAREPGIPFDRWEEGLVMLRYDEAIFVKREGLPGLDNHK